NMMTAVAKPLARGRAIVAIATPPPSRWRSTGKWTLEVALHRLDQPADHALGLRCANGRAGDIADIAATSSGEHCKADQGRKCGTAMSVGQSGDLLWPSKPY